MLRFCSVEEGFMITSSGAFELRFYLESSFSIVLRLVVFIWLLTWFICFTWVGLFCSEVIDDVIMSLVLAGG